MKNWQKFILGFFIIIIIVIPSYTFFFVNFVKPTSFELSPEPKSLEAPIISKETIVTFDSNSSKIIIDTIITFNVSLRNRIIEFDTISSDCIFTDKDITILDINSTFKTAYNADINTSNVGNINQKKSVYLLAKDGKFIAEYNKEEKIIISYEKTISKEDIDLGIVSEEMGFSNVFLNDSNNTSYIIKAKSLDSNWAPLLPFDTGIRFDEKNNTISAQLTKESKIGHVTFQKKGIQDSRIQTKIELQENSTIKEEINWDFSAYNDIMDLYVPLSYKNVNALDAITIVLNDGEVKKPVRYNSVAKLDSQELGENFLGYALNRETDQVTFLKIRIKYPNLKRIMIQIFIDNPTYAFQNEYKYYYRIGAIPIAHYGEPNSSAKVIFEIPKNYNFGTIHTEDINVSFRNQNVVEFKLDSGNTPLKLIQLDIEYYFRKTVTVFMFYTNLIISILLILLLFVKWQASKFNLSYTLHKSINNGLFFVPLSVELPLLLSYSNYVGFFDLLVSSNTLLLLLIWGVINYIILPQEDPLEKQFTNFEEHVKGLVSLEHKINSALILINEQIEEYKNKKDKIT